MWSSQMVLEAKKKSKKSPSNRIMRESWLDTSSTHIFKLYDGTAWRTPKAVVSNSNGKPVNPTDGQLHYDQLIPGLFMYNAATAAWIAI